MKVWGVTEEEIRAAASSVGLALFQDYYGQACDKDGRALRFRLSVDPGSRREDGTLPYQRISQARDRPRRLSAVCWHGHRDFMRALFELQPEARIKTALADYRGSEDFEETYRETFGEGNDYNLAYGQACVCSEH